MLDTDTTKVSPVDQKAQIKKGPREFFSRKHTIIVSYGKPITKEELFGKDHVRLWPSPVSRHSSGDPSADSPTHRIFELVAYK